MAVVDRAPKSTDIVGKTIARLLQTEWEHLERFSHCNFYVEFTDGTLLYLDYDSMELVGDESRNELQLRPVDINESYPAFFSSDGELGIGARVERVLTTTYHDVYLVLVGEHYLRAELEEAQTQLELMNHQEFLYWATIHEYFDYWTKELVIYNNIRAIDLKLISKVDDLVLWQSAELFLAADQIKDGNDIPLSCLPNTPTDIGWTARFVVPEPGLYRFSVQRRGPEFFIDMEIDQAVIDRGWLEICIK
jgi:hypothetical protein